MEVCGLAIAVAKDGREYILNACDCTFSLMGDTQEEDRRQIADLVVSRMQVRFYLNILVGFLLIRGGIGFNNGFKFLERLSSTNVEGSISLFNLITRQSN